MRIQLLLNPKAPNSGEIEADLRGEVNALATPGTRITTESAPPPPGTLPLGQVLQFIIERTGDVKELVPFATAVLQVTAEVLRRRGIKARASAARKSRRSSRRSPATRKEAAMVFLVEGKKLELPVSDARQRKFLAQLASAASVSKSRMRTPSKRRRK